MVVVHAQKRARTGAKTHNIHAFVHPGEEADAFDVSLANGEEEKKKSKDNGERGRNGRRGSSHLHNRLPEEEEEDEGEV